MMRVPVVLVAAVLALASHRAAGQAVTPPPLQQVQHERSTPVPEGRYEIIQSTLSARVTLRFDRWTGATWQLVQRSDSGGVGWSLPTLRIAHPDRDPQVLNRANYVLFSSGLTVAFTLMVNVNSGATWQLKEDPKQGLYWDPVL